MKAAEKGNEQAQINCANIYQFGPQEFQNINKAKYWLQKAVQKDNPIAHANLGIIGIQENKYAEAIPHLKIAAEKGQRLGQYNYGTLFLMVRAFPKIYDRLNTGLRKLLLKTYLLHKLL